MTFQITSRRMVVAVLLLAAFAAGDFSQSLFGERNTASADLQPNAIPAELLVSGLRIRVVLESTYFEGEIIQNQGSWVKFKASDGDRWINTAAYHGAWQILSEKKS